MTTDKQEESITSSTDVPDQDSCIERFKKIIAEEEKAINNLCQTWQTTLQEVVEEVSDEIREKCDVAVGMAGVLLGRKGKFHQFKGLVAEAEDGTKDKVPTEDDLEGFWGMVALQVWDLLCTRKKLL